MLGSPGYHASRDTSARNAARASWAKLREQGSSVEQALLHCSETVRVVKQDQVGLPSSPSAAAGAHLVGIIPRADTGCVTTLPRLCARSTPPAGRRDPADSYQGTYMYMDYTTHYRDACRPRRETSSTSHPSISNRNTSTTGCGGPSHGHFGPDGRDATPGGEPFLQSHGDSTTDARRPPYLADRALPGQPASLSPGRPAKPIPGRDLGFLSHDPAVVPQRPAPPAARLAFYGTACFVHTATRRTAYPGVKCCPWDGYSATAAPRPATGLSPSRPRAFSLHLNDRPPGSPDSAIACN